MSAPLTPIPAPATALDAPCRPAAPGAAAADGRTWFEALTPHGPLRLCAPLGGRNALHAALALQHCELLLDAIDAWLGAEQDWAWIGTPSSPLAASTHTYAEWRAGQPDGPALPVLLEWPWALLRAAGEPPPALRARLRWPHVGAVLVAAQWRIEAVQLGEIEPGGVVVIAPSFAAEWRGRLRAGHEAARPGVGVPVLLSAPDGARVVGDAAAQPADAADATDADPMPWCELRLDPLQSLSSDRLTGWSVVEIGAVEPVATVWRCASRALAAQPLASGRLMPWGSGWALVVETVGVGAADADLMVLRPY